MRNVVVGSFVGFVLAVAFLAACGSGNGGDGAPPQATVPGEWRWGPLQPTGTITTSAILTSGDIWTSTASYDNADAGRRNRFAAFELLYTPSPSAGGFATLQVGLLPAPDGERFATEPEWVGEVSVSLSDGGRAVVSGIPIPPTQLKFALRQQGGATTVRINSFSITPYNEVTP